MGIRHEFEQILVTGEVSREQTEVEEGLAVVGPAMLFETRGLHEVEFAADQRFYPGGFGGVVEGNGPVKIAMIGQREGGHLEIDRPLHEPVYPAGPVEQTIVGMDVEMNEVFVGRRHRIFSQAFRGWLARSNRLIVGKMRRYFCWVKKPLTEAVPNGLLLGFSLSDPYLHMSIEINIRKNEPIDRAIRRLKKKLERENVIKDVRFKRYFEKPCEKRRRKDKVAAFTQMLRNRHAE